MRLRYIRAAPAALIIDAVYLMMLMILFIDAPRDVYVISFSRDADVDVLFDSAPRARCLR